MRPSTRYLLLGSLLGLLAPAVSWGYHAATGSTVDTAWSSGALAFVGLGIFPVVGRIIGRRHEVLLLRNQELTALVERLRALSTIDALTGIDNRRSFDNRLEMELARTRRYEVPCSLVMIDLDRFKLVNDRHGHQAGDEILRHIAAIASNEKRDGDLVARYGGEELVAILPHTEEADARQWAERVRARIEGAPTLIQGKAVQLTASFGVAATPPLAASPAELIAAADRALYAAKLRGRNTVVAASGSPERRSLTRPRAAS